MTTGGAAKQLNVEVRELIEQALRAQGWSLGDLASHLEISQTTLYRIRKGSSKRVAYSLVQKLHILIGDQVEVQPEISDAALRRQQARVELLQEIKTGLRITASNLLELSAKFETLSLLEGLETLEMDKVTLLPVNELSAHVHEMLRTMNRVDEQTIEFTRESQHGNL